MLSTYPAIFMKEDDGYSAIFPDLNYLATCGDDLNETIEMATDCLAGYLYTSKLDGKNINKPSDVNYHAPKRYVASKELTLLFKKFDI